jgi:hypothetical protein
MVQMKETNISLSLKNRTIALLENFSKNCENTDVRTKVDVKNAVTIKIL